MVYYYQQKQKGAKMQKKVKALISISILFTIALLGLSVFFIVKINLAKNTIAQQQTQIQQLEQIIDHLNNPPSNNDQTITGGN
jgi:flagellar basal body-associated protein FliL